eukprot:TRINITY_DN4397_c0_g1_i1.p1 TRINITY_DN4397_c0_g1~~TRINITY_DN4397_c0_g1_i1.p1  ORF type:complete len:80 (-),score=0.29 TRINITY_DN4397_c0_g1_i1:63-302(-)
MLKRPAGVSRIAHVLPCTIMSTYSFLLAYFGESSSGYSCCSRLPPSPGGVLWLAYFTLLRGTSVLTLLRSPLLPGPSIQ